MAQYAGTLRVKVIKPVKGGDWDLVGARLHTLHRSLSKALNLTQRDLYPDGIAMIEACQQGDKAATNAAKAKLRRDGEKTLRRRWNEQLVQQAEYDKREADKPQKEGATKKKFYPDAHLPIIESVTAETVDHILSRWTGEHFKDLLASRSSIPSWRQGTAFFYRNRAVTVEGPVKKARLTLPVFNGRRKVVFAVAPCGSGHEALWRELIAREGTEGRRQELVRAIKALRVQKKEAKKASGGAEMEALQEAIRAKQGQLASFPWMKLGRVGVTYDKKKKCWFALISYIRNTPDEATGSKEAAVHVGYSCFIKAIASDGHDFYEQGGGVIAARRRFYNRRRSLQKTLNSMGKGSNGHGKKRKLLPLTKLEGKESDFVTTKCGQIAARFRRWCIEHGVGTVILPDVAGQRDAFEKRTEGEAPSELKRHIHSFPYHQLTQTVAYELNQHGIKAETTKARPKPGCCPLCGHDVVENLKSTNAAVESRMIDGKQWTRTEKQLSFQCCECRFKSTGDNVAAAHVLMDRGHDNPLPRLFAKKAAQEAAEELQGADSDSLTGPAARPKCEGSPSNGKKPTRKPRGARKGGSKQLESNPS